MSSFINSECFNILCEHGSKEYVHKGHVFYESSIHQDYIYCLSEGLCALISLKESGKEHIYHYLKSGALVGIVPAYFKSINQASPSPEPFFMLIAKKNCTVYKMHYSSFFPLIAKKPELLQFIIFSIAETSRNLLKHLYTTTEINTVSKLANTLLFLAQEENNKFVITKEFNYTELAKYLDVHLITISKIMSAFKDLGIINKKGLKIIILKKEELLLYSKNIKTLQY
ncbi:MAG: Crp/Fnr family transcriptional regulator [Cellulosilyticaceae bacterium]